MAGPASALWGSSLGPSRFSASGSTALPDTGGDDAEASPVCPRIVLVRLGADTANRERCDEPASPKESSDRVLRPLERELLRTQEPVSK